MVAVGAHTGTEPIDDTFIQQFIGEWVAAWNSHEPSRLTALMTPDCVIDDAAAPRQMRGHADMEEFVRGLWRAAPDMEFTGVAARVPGEAKGMAFWHGRATMTGRLDPPGFAPTNGRMDVDGFDYYEFRDGKVARLVTIQDMAEVGRQVLAVPAAGSLAERPVVWLQRLQAWRARRSAAKR
jgi:steroid delta-isomerase-like uncharacterized protein